MGLNLRLRSRRNSARRITTKVAAEAASGLRTLLTTEAWKSLLALEHPAPK